LLEAIRNFEPLFEVLYGISHDELIANFLCDEDPEIEVRFWTAVGIVLDNFFAEHELSPMAIKEAVEVMRLPTPVELHHLTKRQAKEILDRFDHALDTVSVPPIFPKFAFIVRPLLERAAPLG
jgi:hypothetical protein